MVSAAYETRFRGRGVVRAEIGVDKSYTEPHTTLAPSSTCHDDGVQEYPLVPSVALMYVKTIPLALAVLKFTAPWKWDTSIPAGAARLTSTGLAFARDANAAARMRVPEGFILKALGVLGGCPCSWLHRSNGGPPFYGRYGRYCKFWVSGADLKRITLEGEKSKKVVTIHVSMSLSGVGRSRNLAEPAAGFAELA